MRVAFGTERDTDVSDAVKAHLAALGHETVVIDEGLGWAEIGLAVGHSVAAGRTDRGVAFCGNGVGVTMAANKVDGARAALCATPLVASAARRFNDANVLTLGLEVVPSDIAVEIVEAFLTVESDGSEADQIQALTQVVSLPRNETTAVAKHLAPRGSVPSPDEVVGPVDATLVPRYAGFATFARLPTIWEISRADVAILGVPVDSGVSYRPGARFGPAAIRESSRLLRTGYDPVVGVAPFATQQVADAGDVAASPYGIENALAEITHDWGVLADAGATVLCLGGDHTVTLGCLRAVFERFGPVALVHFDAHLDTWDTYFGNPYTHGSFLRRASEEGLFRPGASMHVGIRGPVYDSLDISRDEELGFAIVRGSEVGERGTAEIVQRIRERVGRHPVYISVDIDVLDPAHAPGTGTPEIGGLTSRELLELLLGFRGLHLVGTDVVEVAPAYDHAELTSLAAATLIYQMISMVAVSRP